MRLIDADKLRALYKSRGDAVRARGDHCSWYEAEMWNYAIQMLDSQMTLHVRFPGSGASKRPERCVVCGYESDVGWKCCPHCGHWKYRGKE